MTTSAVLLHEVARCRAGDKGDDSILVLSPRQRERLDLLAAVLDPAAVAAHFGGMSADDVEILVLASL